MGAGDKALFFFSCLGAFNGVILSIYFFFFNARKHLPGYLLGALLLVLSIRIGKSVVYFFDYGLPKIYLQIGLTACFFIGPFLFFYIKAETGQVKKLPSPWLWQLVLWFLLIITAGLIFPYERFPRLWGRYMVPLIYLQWAVYVALSVIAVIPLLQAIGKKEKLHTSGKWVLVICASVTLFLVSYVWAYLNITKGSYINGALWFSLILYGVVFTLLYRKNPDKLFSPAVQKYADKKLDPSEVQLIIQRLEKTMKEKEFFRNPNLKIHDLAREIHISSHQLSQVLNENIRKNFTLFVNEYRISEACKLLAEPTNLTIEAIGEEVGFNSRSTFFASFKKIMGTTPSVYQQSLPPDL